jgi:NO-binding membrane sensor protein with MHYT domain
MDEDKNCKPACSAGVDLRRRIMYLDKENDDQWKVINQLRNRLPVWATVVFGLLTFLLGASMSYAAMVGR